MVLSYVSYAFVCRDMLTGNAVSYADFIVASLLQYVKRLGPELYDRFVAHDKAFEDLYKACAKWLERDDH